MDELLIRVLVRLVRVHDELGEAAFEDAAHGALMGIGKAAHRAAEAQRGLRPPPSRDGSVVIFCPKRPKHS